MNQQAACIATDLRPHGTEHLCVTGRSTSLHTCTDQKTYPALPRSVQVEPTRVFSPLSGADRFSGLRALAWFLLPTASRLNSQCVVCGVRSRLPLRGSPGITPGSLDGLGLSPRRQHEAKPSQDRDRLSSRMQTEPCCVSIKSASSQHHFGRSTQRFCAQ